MHHKWRLEEWSARLPTQHTASHDVTARVRAAQLTTILALTPHMMVVNIVNATIASFFLYRDTPHFLLLCWYSTILIVAALGLFQWFARRKQAPPIRASKQSLSGIVRNAFILGLIWGVLPVIAWPFVAIEPRNMLVAVMAGMIGGGCLTLYIVPQAMIVWVATILTGTSIGLLMRSSVYDIALISLLTIFCLTMIRAGRAASVTFVESRISSETVKEQAETISMLLSDFSEGSRDWLWETDRNGYLTRGLQQFAETVGIDPSVSDRQACLVDALDSRACAQLRRHFLDQTAFHNFIVEFRKPHDDDADSIWISLSAKPILDENNRFLGYRGVGSNVTEIHEAERQIAYLAWHDALTGLVNRAHFESELHACMASETASALFYLDLDGFKVVNDQFGHAMGDKLLREVALRLTKIVGPEDMVARLGGDEFAILSPTSRNRQLASRRAQRIINVIGKPYEIDEAVLKISVSVGIAFTDFEAGSIVEWLKRADLALYRAKAEGKSDYRFYEAAMDEVVRRHRMIEHELGEAVARDEISVAYQPFCCVRTGRVHGFEALARWRHPELGDVQPADFIPIAERMGIIGDLSNAVLRQACAFAVDWPSEMVLSVNLSPQQLHSGRIVSFVESILQDTGMKAERLEFEITESTFLNHTKSVLEQLSDLKAIGVSIALDDFGTGYSALSYLMRFSFDKLKIDRSFVEPSGHDSAAHDMLETIVRLAQVLDLSITAEGVENASQAEILAELGCDFMQGFGIARPLTANQVPVFLLENKNELCQLEHALSAKVS